MDKETKEVVKYLGKWAVGLTAGYFFVVRPVLKKTGIISDSPPLETMLATPKMKQAFSSDLAVKYQIPAYVTPAHLAADKLYNSKGTFNDDENMIYSVYRDAKNLLYLSYVNWMFNHYYKQDLLPFLTDFLSDDEIYHIKQLIEKLPIK